jgi:anti-sigma regulatory factor (Ser/Thr protein kinase)
MGQLRAVLKHLLVTEPDLAAALAAADRFAAGEPALHAATVCVAVLDPAGGGLRYATCGHPPPLLVTLDGTARFLPASGAGPLGAGSAPATLASALLAPGELVLLYSDGLIERPGRTSREAMAELAVVAADAAAGRALTDSAAATPADRVCQQTVELLTRTGYSDDVTTLAAWRPSAPVPALDMELPAELSTVTALCGAMDEWLEQSGATVADREAVRLAVTETVANAVEHAYPPGQRGPVRLEAAIDGRAYLEVRVSDQGRWRPPDHAETERGHGLMLAEYLAASMTLTHPRGEAAGTTVTLRYRLRRPATLGSQPGISLAASPPATRFTAELVTGGAAPSIRVAGPVDITTGDSFAGRLLAACRGGILPLTADLTGVTVLASAGVSVLHRIRAQLAAHQHDLTLIAVEGSTAAAVLDLVRLQRTSTRGEEGHDRADPARRR